MNPEFPEDKTILYVSSKPKISLNTEVLKHLEKNQIQKLGIIDSLISRISGKAISLPFVDQQKKITNCYYNLEQVEQLLHGNAAEVKDNPVLQFLDEAVCQAKFPALEKINARLGELQVAKLDKGLENRIKALGKAYPKEVNRLLKKLLSELNQKYIPVSVVMNSKGNFQVGLQSLRERKLGNDNTEVLQKEILDSMLQKPLEEVHQTLIDQLERFPKITRLHAFCQTPDGERHLVMVEKETDPNVISVEDYPIHFSEDKIVINETEILCNNAEELRVFLNTQYGVRVDPKIFDGMSKEEQKSTQVIQKNGTSSKPQNRPPARTFSPVRPPAQTATTTTKDRSKTSVAKTSPGAIQQAQKPVQEFEKALENLIKYLAKEKLKLDEVDLNAIRTKFRTDPSQQVMDALQNTNFMFAYRQKKITTEQIIRALYSGLGIALRRFEATRPQFTTLDLIELLQQNQVQELGKIDTYIEKLRGNVLEMTVENKDGSIAKHHYKITDLEGLLKQFDLSFEPSKVAHESLFQLIKNAAFPALHKVEDRLNGLITNVDSLVSNYVKELGSTSPKEVNGALERLLSNLGNKNLSISEVNEHINRFGSRMQELRIRNKLSEIVFPELRFDEAERIFKERLLEQNLNEPLQFFFQTPDKSFYFMKGTKQKDPANFELSCFVLELPNDEQGVQARKILKIEAPFERRNDRNDTHENFSKPLNDTNIYNKNENTFILKTKKSLWQHVWSRLRATVPTHPQKIISSPKLRDLAQMQAILGKKWTITQIPSDKLAESLLTELETTTTPINTKWYTFQWDATEGLTFIVAEKNEDGVCEIGHYPITLSDENVIIRGESFPAKNFERLQQALSSDYGMYKQI